MNALLLKTQPLKTQPLKTVLLNAALLKVTLLKAVLLKIVLLKIVLFSFLLSNPTFAESMDQWGDWAMEPEQIDFGPDSPFERIPDNHSTEQTAPLNARERALFNQLDNSNLSDYIAPRRAEGAPMENALMPGSDTPMLEQLEQLERLHDAEMQPDTAPADSSRERLYYYMSERINRQRGVTIDTYDSHDAMTPDGEVIIIEGVEIRDDMGERTTFEAGHYSISTQAYEGPTLEGIPLEAFVEEGILDEQQLENLMENGDQLIIEDLPPELQDSLDNYMETHDLDEIQLDIPGQGEIYDGGLEIERMEIEGTEIENLDEYDGFHVPQGFDDFPASEMDGY
ncbi:MAG: hypothetical protein OIF57_12375 [Marinobacterium sp.]|nr:hypothetical protein [Marinobacterium sp.]